MTWMLYGANGYTGELIARLAEKRGERPLLAGRSAEKIAPLAVELGLDHLVLDLSDGAALRHALADLTLVVHCAGPYAHTAAPMVDACLATGTHYVDLAGEMDVMEAIYARHEDAQRAGVVLLPAAGFDVVATDCLAAMLAAKLPGAVELDLALTSGGGISPGTLKSVLQSAGNGGRARVDGVLRQVDLGFRQVVAEFPSGPRRVTAVPWPDLVSAYRSTGIRTITTYAAIPGSDMLARNPQAQQWLGSLLRVPAVQRVGASLVDQFVRGPSQARQASQHTEVWGRVRDGERHSASGSLTTPGSYAFTAESVLHAVTRLLADDPGTARVTPGAAWTCRP